MGSSILYRFLYLTIQFVASLLLANLLKPAAFGVISLLIVNASFFSLVTGLGIESIVVHKLTNKKWGINESYTFLGIGAVLQVFLFIVLQLAAIYFTKHTLLSHSSPDYFALELTYFTGLVLVEKLFSLLYPLHFAKATNVILLVCAAAFTILMFAFPLFGTVDLHTGFQFFAGYTFLQGLVLSIFFYWKVKGLHFIKPPFESLLTAMRLSLLVMLTNVVQLLAYRVDFWMINYFHGDAEVGIFAQANKMANLIWILPNIIAALLMPRFIQFSQSDFRLIIKAAFWLNVLVSAGALLVSTFLFWYVLAPEYSSGLHAFYLMFPGYFFWGVVIYYGAYVSWKGDFRRNLLASSLCFLLILVFDALLISQFSINGAAVANTLVYTIVFIYYLRTVNIGVGQKLQLFIGKSELKQLQSLLRG